ncbi:MAG: hypothetical protein M3O71_21570 [Bacteroidota bacterium]|nr:hypothetical protein [Bacteroidota bacterium]
MAGSKLTNRVKASSILEVIVSMVVIVIVFGIAMMIYANVLRVSPSAKKLRAQAILENEMLKAEHSTDSLAQFVTIDDFRIDEELKPYPDNADLSIVHLAAFDQNQQKIAELQKIILNKHE